jgi:diamine N-acetyltransferase
MIILRKMLENDSIRLRAPEPEDLDILYKWENDTEVWEHSSTLVPFSRFTLRQHIENAGNDIYETHQLRLIVVSVEDDKPIGVIDLFEFDPHNRRAGVGILIDEHFRRRGLASMALDLFREYAFSQLGLQQLHAVVILRNDASIKLFESCGYIRSGLLKKWLRVLDGYEDVVLFQCML